MIGNQADFQRILLEEVSNDYIPTVSHMIKGKQLLVKNYLEEFLIVDKKKLRKIQIQLLLQIEQWFDLFI